MIRTDRLILRPFEARDEAPFAAINADPEVMRYFETPMTRAESDDLIARIEARRQETGFGFFAVEMAGELIGMCGLSQVGPQMPFAPAVEIGWRLARAHWGQGLAAEAARAALDWGFRDKNLTEIVAFTTPDNAPSRALMARLGMRHDRNAGFRHPGLSAQSRLNPLVLYRLERNPTSG